MDTFTSNEKMALDRLILEAKTPTGEGGRVADFLLAWWNADTCGGFNPIKAWSCEDNVVEDIVTIFSYIVRNQRRFPDYLGYGEKFESLMRQWRPGAANTPMFI